MSNVNKGTDYFGLIRASRTLIWHLHL